MRAWLLAAAVCACVLAPLVGRADDLAWSRLVVAEHPVSVELPKRAKSRHQTSDWGLARAETDVLEVHAFGGVLSANATVAPSLAIRMAGHDLIFLTTRDTVLRKSGGAKVAWEEVSRSGVAGKRLTYTVDDHGTPLRGTMEVYVFDPYIVTFDALLPSDAPADAADRFFKSIRLKELARGR
ncbi:MAG: hypothetical protein H6732_07800 [Alphaproteobacteria bacterium]|nr:hypothetical protein [Alphaproteobacteria bacterium]